MFIKAKTYNNCGELPMARFIRCADGDLTALYRYEPKWWHKKKDLTTIWNNIKAEYDKLTGDNGITEMFLYSKEAIYLSMKLNLAEQLIDKLNTYGYSKKTCDVLRRLGFQFQFTTASYASDLKMVVAQAKNMAIRLNSVNKAIDELQLKEQQNSKDGDFHSLTVALERNMQGVNIDLESCPVSKFIAYLNNVKDYGQRAKN